MTLMSFASGTMLAFIPFTLTRSGFPAWVAGSAVTAIAAGGIVGCLVTGMLIRRVGHARVFACFAGLTILSMAIIGLGLDPVVWLIARFLYGLSANANFIVSQSWLNHSSDNSWRGRAMSVFYMAYVIGIGVGSLTFGLLPQDGMQAPIVAIIFATLGILPISLTRLQTPPPPERTSVDLRAAWKISPVGMVGIAASGGLSMLVQGFTPIYVAKSGYGQGDVALLMFLMQLGMLGIQLPLGALSDRIDRRYVLLITCGIITVSALAATISPVTGFALLAVIFAVWSGATETVYSVAHAHANDRADPSDYVTLASTMLVVWSGAAFILPAIVTTATTIFGPKTYMSCAIALALLLALFVFLRLMKGTKPVTPEEAEAFGIRTAQAPNADVPFNPEEEENPVLSLPS
jgi:MFS family permease